jgi:hypothetical protein
MTKHGLTNSGAAKKSFSSTIKRKEMPGIILNEVHHPGIPGLGWKQFWLPGLAATMLCSASWIDRWWALHLAITSRLSIQRWKDINIRNESYCTPLTFAAQYHWCAVRKALLDRGSDIVAVDYRRDLLLHFAVDRGDATIIKALLERNAPSDLKNSRGQTPRLVGNMERLRRFGQAAASIMWSPLTTETGLATRL